MPAIYALADVFVLPSEREPWGLAVNEAMACGTAVVASDEVGAAYDLIDESCGRIVRSGDPEDLAAAIRIVLAHAPEMGMAARRRIAAWDFHADLRGLRQALVYVTAGVR
jgi:glycosyltransferase involved in cell wall biosynthesis